MMVSMNMHVAVLSVTLGYSAKQVACFLVVSAVGYAEWWYIWTVLRGTLLQCQTGFVIPYLGLLGGLASFAASE